MDTIIVDPLYNTPGKHDDSGAFEPHAELLKRVMGGRAERWSFDNTDLNMLRRFESLCSIRLEDPDARELKNFIHIGHGFHNHCQCGLDIAHVPDLRDHIPECRTFILLSCSTASAPLHTSLAWNLAHLPGKTEIPRVLAHTTAGRDVENPYAMLITEHGARYIVGPGTTHWKAWVRFLRTDGWVLMVRAVLEGPEGLNFPGFVWDDAGFLDWTPVT